MRSEGKCFQGKRINLAMSEVLSGLGAMRWKGCLVKIKTGRKNVFREKARNHRLQEPWAWQDTNEAGQVPHCLLRWFLKYGPRIWVGREGFPCVSQKTRKQVLIEGPPNAGCFAYDISSSLTTTRRKSCCYPHPIGAEIKVQKGWVTCLKTHS